MKEKEDIVFSRNSVEFVTVAAEFCAYLEKSGEQPRKDFVETLLKLLPLLYIKAQMLPEEEPITDETLEHFVTEDSYEVLRMTIFDILADKDAYLDVFVSDMKYSDTPIAASVAESLADIFQDLFNFVSVVKDSEGAQTMEALGECKENFEAYWSQTLCNVLRALNHYRYSS